MNSVRRPPRRARLAAAARLAIFFAAAFASSLLATPLRAADDPDKPQIVRIDVGFGGVYKLGCWTPVAITARGGVEPQVAAVTAVLPDSDGTPVEYGTPTGQGIALTPGAESTVRLLVRPGQDGGSLTVVLRDEQGRELARRRFFPAPPDEEADAAAFPYGVAPSSRLIIAVGCQEGLTDLLRKQSPANVDTATHCARLADGEALPALPLGYDGVDAVLLFGSSPEAYRALGAGNARRAALAQWVRGGGRVVMFCGAAAPELLAGDGLFAQLAPGRYDSLGRLKEAAALESFAGGESLVSRSPIDLPVPKLTDVTGQVLAYRGTDPADLPLVVRGLRGLGEVTFVGVDVDQPPLDKWEGRGAFLTRALGWQAATTVVEGGAPSVASGTFSELIDQLRYGLDRRFANVTPVSFGVVATLVLAYVALIGPGDYLLVKFGLKRMEATWITFPLIVLGATLGAWSLARWLKGDQLRLNQVEIVDVDAATGTARGTTWAHFFSPRAERFDLRLAPRWGEQPLPDGALADDRPPHPAWLGLTGAGLGGMIGQREGLNLFSRGYRIDQRYSRIADLPVEEWSTKTLVASWSAEGLAPIESALTRQADELVAGRLTNRTGVRLVDAALLHGRWAYPLPDLDDGKEATISDALQPRNVRSLLAGRDAGDENPSHAGQESVVPYDSIGDDVKRIAKAMMFHQALGGESYTGPTNRYPQGIDLSRVLQGDEAILLAQVADGRGSEWRRAPDDEPLGGPDDRRWVFYRVILPVEEPVEAGTAAE